MKKNMFIYCLLVFILGIGFISLQAGQNKSQATENKLQAPPPTPANPAEKKHKTSYAIGYSIGTNLKMVESHVDLDVLVKGLKDAAKGIPCELKQPEMEQILQNFQNEMRQKQMDDMKKMGDKNKQEGEKFLKQNAGKKGVVSTKSGLQYEVLKKGTGPKPQATDSVKVHYKGTLLSGKEFDSSYKRNTPATLSLGGVIKGWTEGIQLMNVGSKYKFYIPAELGYGDRGAGGAIEPNSTLIFEVELLGIDKPVPPAPNQPAKPPVPENKKK